jgi:hypothetical protein
MEEVDRLGHFARHFKLPGYLRHCDSKSEWLERPVRYVYAVCTTRGPSFHVCT